ncbi:unnamed protein product [Peniophora sp. CBMAI 1063]|nr:unnamed protein product [Peniophora sp. CBMAI 1063]
MPVLSLPRWTTKLGYRARPVSISLDKRRRSIVRFARWYPIGRNECMQTDSRRSSLRSAPQSRRQSLYYTRDEGQPYTTVLPAMNSEEDVLQQDYMRSRDSRAFPSTDDIVHWQEERQKGTVTRTIGNWARHLRRQFTRLKRKIAGKRQ